MVKLEDEVQGALVTSALLTAALVDARRGNNLKPVVGNQIIRMSSQITAALGTVGGEGAQMHRAVKILSERLGIQVDAYGDETDTPSGFYDPGA